jgi:hypothetical protein
MDDLVARRDHARMPATSQRAGWLRRAVVDYY